MSGGFLLAASVIALRWAANADLVAPRTRLSSIALTDPTRQPILLAGTTASAIAHAVAADWWLIAAYVATVTYWCRYGAHHFPRPQTRRVASLMVGSVVTAGVCSVVENLLLLHHRDGIGTSRTVATWTTAMSLSRWITFVPAAFTAALAVASFVARTGRWLLGPRLEPGFFGPTPNVVDPDVGRFDHSDLHSAIARRTNADGEAGAIGICLSGGGIRAAAVSLGVIQAIQEPDADGRSLYQRARYLATVSGGGYLAGATQLLAHRQRDTPIGAQGPFAEGSSEAAYLISNNQYLWPPISPKTPGAVREFFITIAAALAYIAFNVALVVATVWAISEPIGWLIGQGLGLGSHRHPPASFWIALLFGLVGLAPAGARLVRDLVRSQFKLSRRGLDAASWAIVAVVGAALVVVLGYGVAANRWWPRSGPAEVAFVVAVVSVVYMLFRRKSALASFVVPLGAVLMVGSWIEHGLDGPASEVSRLPALVVGSIVVSLFLGLSVATVARVYYARRRAPEEHADQGVDRPTSDTKSIFRRVAAMAVLSGFGLFAILVVYFGDRIVGRCSTDTPGQCLMTSGQLWLGVVGALIAIYLTTDQKQWSLHPLYKRRLATSFALVRQGPADGANGGTAAQLPFHIGTTLSEWGRQPTEGPELLVCAAVYEAIRTAEPASTTLGPKTVGLRNEIKAWPFVFSARYVGGAEVGWTRTLDFEAALGRTNGPDGTLLAAMAISGAAISPAIGQIRLHAVNAIISLGNARLGVWLPSPAYVNTLRGLIPTPEGRNAQWVRLRRFTYLFKEIGGLFDTEDRFVYVTDGGEFDNLGLIELLTRRCATIYCFDASGDSKRDGTPNTATLAGVLRLAERRYGMQFTQLPAGDRASLLAKLSDDDVPPALATIAKRLRRAAVIEFSVVYPAADGSTVTTGRIVFAKAVLTPDCGDVNSTDPTDPLRFVLDHPHRAARFPSDSTADQWLDPDQFEAYVRLGRYMARRARGN